MRVYELANIFRILTRPVFLSYKQVLLPYTSKMGSTNGSNGNALSNFRYIPLSYNNADSETSALRLVLTLNPDWEGPGNKIEFVRFTDGITNTVCFLQGVRLD